jgi:uncharacterized protein YbjT (DUF2867 family)
VTRDVWSDEVEIAMQNVIVLGAAGQIARHVVDTLVHDQDIHLTLYLRQAQRLTPQQSTVATVVEGDVFDSSLLVRAMQNQQIVYANLGASTTASNSGEDIGQQAEHVISAMKSAYVRRLIFIASAGIYDEIPGAFGEWCNREIGAALVPFRKAAQHIEASGLDYTIIRPTWMSDDNEIDYEITSKGQYMRGTEISRKSVADLVVHLIKKPSEHVGSSLGINKPGTYWDKPPLKVRLPYASHGVDQS